MKNPVHLAKQLANDDSGTYNQDIDLTSLLKMTISFFHTKPGVPKVVRDRYTSC